MRTPETSRPRLAQGRNGAPGRATCSVFSTRGPLNSLGKQFRICLLSPPPLRGQEAALTCEEKRSPSCVSFKVKGEAAQSTRFLDPAPGCLVFSPHRPSISWANPESRGPRALAGPGGQPGLLVTSCPSQTLPRQPAEEATH